MKISVTNLNPVVQIELSENLEALHETMELPIWGGFRRILGRFRRKAGANKLDSMSPRSDVWIPRSVHLKVHGKQVLELGDECGTCGFMYKYLKGPKPPISPENLSSLLKDGLQDISQELIDTISVLLPTGEYLVGLFEIAPKMIIPKETDYLGYGSVRFPFYLGRKYQIDEKGVVREAIVPLFQTNTLNSSVCREYEERILLGAKPTALSYSIIEGRHVLDGVPADAPDDWSLMHFLLDGHHKIFAANKTNSKITLLSFLQYPYIDGWGVTTHEHSVDLDDYIWTTIYKHV